MGKVALAAAATLVHSLHTGTFTAMALKVNLSSAEGDWKEIKGEAVIKELKRTFYSMLQKKFMRGITWPKTPVTPDLSSNLQDPLSSTHMYCFKTLFSVIKL